MLPCQRPAASVRVGAVDVKSAIGASSTARLRTSASLANFMPEMTPDQSYRGTDAGRLACRCRQQSEPDTTALVSATSTAF